jgi:hypothetical protein
MSNSSPVRIVGSVEERLWDPLARVSDLHRPVINRNTDTPDFVVLQPVIAVSANLCQVMAEHVSMSRGGRGHLRSYSRSTFGTFRWWRCTHGSP